MVVQQQPHHIYLRSSLVLSCTVDSFKQRENTMSLGYPFYIMLQPVAGYKKAYSTFLQLDKRLRYVRIQFGHIFLETHKFKFQQQLISTTMNRNIVFRQHYSPNIVQQHAKSTKYTFFRWGVTRI
ncbi:hypothetical protein D3C77_567590 [compost metagenome]